MQKRILSLYLLATIVFSNLVMLCPESDAGPGSIHFILEACSSPSCDNCSTDSNCKNDLCKHTICNDQMLSDAYNVPHQEKHQIVLPLSEVINHSINFVVLNNIPTSFNAPHFDFPKSSRQMVLRI
jgi:hypothetical protein